MFVRRVLFAFALAILVVGDNAEDDSVYDPVLTYRSAIEKFIQGVTGIFSKPPAPGTSKSSAGGFGQILNQVTGNFRAIFPGTRWCGDGNKTNSVSDLGHFAGTDVCCREHDLCETIMHAGKARGKLYNNGMFTRSECDCDQKFYHCLKAARSLVAKKIGITYFNILAPQCFRLDYPVKSCTSYGWGIFKRKCKEYELDNTKDKTLGWYDNLKF